MTSRVPPALRWSEKLQGLQRLPYQTSQHLLGVYQAEGLWVCTCPHCTISCECIKGSWRRVTRSPAATPLDHLRADDLADLAYKVQLKEINTTKTKWKQIQRSLSHWETDGAGCALNPPETEMHSFKVWASTTCQRLASLDLRFASREFAGYIMIHHSWLLAPLSWTCDGTFFAHAKAKWVGPQDPKLDSKASEHCPEVSTFWSCGNEDFACSCAWNA